MSNYDENIRLRPISQGTILVYNTIQLGMFQTVKEQIKAFQNDLKKKNIEIEPEYFTSFGPFDNIIRFDVDDFCMVNNLSSLPGVSSQQIQCTYTIRRFSKAESGGPGWKPYCTITQLKVQNYLMLGYGPEMEEAIAELLASCLENYLGIDLENKPQIADGLDVELMATLGWDEFFIFMRSPGGFASLYKPVREIIRSLTLADLKPFLEERGYRFAPKDEDSLEFKHLFLASYTTPAYNMEISNELQNYLEAHPKMRNAEKLLSNSELFQSKCPANDFGFDRISVSTRLSVKPGHESRVRAIIRRVIGEIGVADDPVSPEKIFSIGRYDIYPWLNRPMSCREFVILFELLWFSLSGDLKREDNYLEFLEKTQFYNSFTIISYLEESREMENVDKGKPKKRKSGKSEGAFIKQLWNLRLGEGNNRKTIIRAFERDFLKDNVPTSIIIGLARIFALFDSCIADRFTSDSFVEMLPFMQRLREIIDTVDVSPDDPSLLVFKAGEHGIPTVLPESEGEPVRNSLVKVFHCAIRRFYRGYTHRYLSSYPMMDKNETGIDFSGRLHRILSAITGMQNLVLDDLDCHLKKGFNIISTWPNIKILRGSFNISEANVFHLFHTEIFFSMLHEIMHTYIHGDQLKELWASLETAVSYAPIPILDDERVIMDMFFEEVVGDVFLLKNGFGGNFKLFGFWYWLLLMHSQKAVDSNIILRFLFISLLEDTDSKAFMMTKFSIMTTPSGDRFFYSSDPKVILEILEGLIEKFNYPRKIENMMIEKIREFYRDSIDDVESEPKRILDSFISFGQILDALQPKVSSLLESCSYPPGDDDESLFEKMPLPPEEKEGKRQWSSIRLFRAVLRFIYLNKNHLVCENDNVLNFHPQEKKLRRKLLQYRVALINTLQWESLHWKRRLFEDWNIHFPMPISKIGGPNG
ncbi:MAG: hypothetical protein GY950_28485 [bacterium]|nr:hypothetical protein [bacterium]